MMEESAFIRAFSDYIRFRYTQNARDVSLKNAEEMISFHIVSEWEKQLPEKAKNSIIFADIFGY